MTTFNLYQLIIDTHHLPNNHKWIFAYNGFAETNENRYLVPMMEQGMYMHTAILNVPTYDDAMFSLASKPHKNSTPLQGFTRDTLPNYDVCDIVFDVSAQNACVNTGCIYSAASHVPIEDDILHTLLSHTATCMSFGPVIASA